MTKINDTHEQAQDILKNCKLLMKEHCTIINNVVYEKLYDHPYNEKYRFFFSTDDYDYVEDESSIAILDDVFAVKT